MNNKCTKEFWSGAAALIIRGSLATLAVLAISGMVYAQEKAQDNKEQIHFSSIPSPTTPEAITPPAGNSAFLLGHGIVASV